MKKYIRSIMAVGLAGVLGLPATLAARPTNDGNPNYSVVQLKNSQKVLFSCPRTGAARTLIVIKNEQGEKIYREVVDGRTDVARLFDVSKFGYGKYTFVVEAEQKAVKREVELKGMPDSRLVMQVSPAKNGFVHATYLNNYDNATVGIQILDRFGAEVYSTSTTAEEYYKFFNLTHLPKGKYRFVLTCGAQKVSEVIALND